MVHRNPPDSGTASLVESHPLPPGRTTLDAIAAIPEEHVWLAGRKSPRTRRAYRQDVEHFMRTIGIRSVDEFRGMDHRAVPAWEAYMREVDPAEASTIRRRLAALSSLFKHLIKHGAADRNPVRDVARPQEGLSQVVENSKTCASIHPDSTKRVMGFEPTTFTLATCGRWVLNLEVH